VYKWNWDQKKKLNIIPNKVYVLQVPEDGKPQIPINNSLEGKMVHVN